MTNNTDASYLTMGLIGDLKEFSLIFKITIVLMQIIVIFTSLSSREANVFDRMIFNFTHDLSFLLPHSTRSVFFLFNN